MHRLLSRLGPACVVLAVLTGCSAGQIAQTASSVSTVDGTTANVGTIALRDIALAYPEEGVWQPGDDVRLEFVAVNGAPLDSDSLVSVSSPVFGGDSAGASDLPVELPASTDVSFYGSGVRLELTGLTESLRPTVRVPVTFTFQVAGEVTVSVPVGVPQDVVESDAEPFDFHGEE